MREIKFRALAVVNDKHNNIKVGDFVYGHYIENGCDAPCIIFGDGEQIEVDKNTLGQLTGLTDKNNINIYEDDVVHVQYNHLGKITVSFSDGKFNVSNYCLPKCMIVGNIHQNTDLVK